MALDLIPGELKNFSLDLHKMHLFFKSFCPQIIYQVLVYLKPPNKTYKDISITKGFSSDHMFRFTIEGEN